MWHLQEFALYCVLKKWSWRETRSPPYPLLFLPFRERIVCISLLLCIYLCIHTCFVYLFRMAPEPSSKTFFYSYIFSCIFDKKPIPNFIMVDQKKIDRWEKHYSGALERKFYSIQRIDLLIITISGACIYIVFQILQFLQSPDADCINQSTILLKVSAIFSVLAIVVNFLSQISGYHANKNEALYANRFIKQLIADKMDEKALEKFDNKSSHYSKLTNMANTVSAIFMAIGILFLVVYNLITF